MEATRTRRVLWHSPYDESTELCRLTGSAQGFVLEGIVLVPVDGEPARVDYRVEADAAWNTRHVHLRVDSGSSAGELRLGLREDGGWTLDGKSQGHLEGCIDVDLRITPSTNTLPIRRLAPVVGEVVEVRAAWVGFPELEVTPSEQSYERVGERDYIFRSADFEAELAVDDAGLVLRYGDAFWRALAHGLDGDQ